MRPSLLLAAAALLCACPATYPATRSDGGPADGGAPADAGPTPTFSFTVDPALAPAQATTPDGRALAVVSDGAGGTSTFVTNEVVLRVKDDAERDAFLAATGGVVLDSDGVPEPPAFLGVTLDARFREPTAWRVRVDLARADLAAFPGDATRAGLRGAATVSSEDGARLLALVAHQAASGGSAAPNFVGTPAGLFRTTRDQPAGSGNVDLFSDTAFGMVPNPFSVAGGKATVTKAWQFIGARGVPRRVRLAIIDGGFWLTPTGVPMKGPGGRSDLPDQVAQYDFEHGRPIADGPGSSRCTGGSLCPWHGNDCASVALGALDNEYGAGGTGGQLADPVLFRVGMDLFQVMHAVRAAIAWKVDVVSMSFGMCGDNLFCKAAFAVTGYYDAFSDAKQAGLVMVAAAGNEGDMGRWAPCILDGVICVGALNPGTQDAIGYSNYGPHVDVWAPTNIPAMPRPDDPTFTSSSGNLVVAGGTSSSTPFVAGVAAMLRAYDPSLDSDAVAAILRDTAWTGLADAKVTHALNAYEALVAASGRFLPMDAFEPNDGLAMAAPLPVGRQVDLSLSSSTDRDRYAVTTAAKSFVSVRAPWTTLLGKLAFTGLESSDQCGSYTKATLAPRAGELAYGFTVSAGTWVLPFMTASGDPTAYELQLDVTPLAGGLPADLYEYNDTFSTARLLPGSGAGNATLHLPGDVDHYLVTNSGGGGGSLWLGYRFGVVADQPVTLSLLDAGGAVMTTASTPQDCSTGASLTVPVGTWVVRVEGTRATQYAITFGDAYVPPPPLQTIRQALRIDLHGPDPVQFTLVDQAVLIESTTNIDLRQLALDGAGVHASLLDLAGNVLREGQPAVDATGAVTGETLSVADQAGGQPFLVRFERAPDTDLSPSARLPALPFGVSLRTGP